jgi:hypothetical protein
MSIVKNVHQIDRGVRFVLGLVLVVLGVTQLGSNALLGIILIVVGLVLLATAFMGFCPLYRVIGFSTLKKK